MVDLAVRGVLAAMSLFILLSFDDIVSDFISAGVIAVIGYWIVVRRKLVAETAPPTTIKLDPALATAPISDVPLGRMS